MDIQFYGANCLTITTKHARIVIDDNLADLGGKTVAKAGDIVLFTTTTPTTIPQNPKIVIAAPGEYEVSGVSIYGIQARAHMDHDDVKTATMYKLLFDDAAVLITGHIYPELNDTQLETIGMVDIMAVPVGGNGFTLDGVGALKIIKKVEPKIIVPTYYSDASLDFPVPAQSLEQALKALAMEPKETVAKLKLNADSLGDTTQLVIVSRN